MHAGPLPAFRDTIEVEHVCEQKVPVREIVIEAELAEQPFVVGPDALEESPGVKGLRRDLERCGLIQAAVRPETVTYRTTAGGLFSSGGTATSYGLRIRCPLPLLESVIDRLQDHDALTIHNLTWDFGPLETTRAELTERCLRELKAEAARRAKILELPLYGVHRLRLEAPGVPGPALPKRTKSSKVARSQDALVGTWGTSGVLRVKAIGSFLVGTFSAQPGNGGHTS